MTLFLCGGKISLKNLKCYKTYYSWQEGPHLAVIYLPDYLAPKDALLTTLSQTLNSSVHAAIPVKWDFIQVTKPQSSMALSPI